MNKQLQSFFVIGLLCVSSVGAVMVPIELVNKKTDTVHTASADKPDVYSLTLEKDQSYSVLVKNKMKLEIYDESGKPVTDRPVKMVSDQKYRVEVHGKGRYRIGFFQQAVMKQNDKGEKVCVETFQLRVW